ncbi:MAG: MFS transporter, partial [Halobaculum sp.]
AQTLPILGGLVALVAVGKLAVNNAVTPALSAIFDDEDAGTGWGLRDITLYCGSALGLTLGSGLAAGDGIRAVFPALAVVLFGLAVVLWRRVGGRGAGDEAERPADSTDGPATESADGTDRPDRLRDRFSLDRVLSPVRGLSRPSVFARIAVVDLLVGVGTAALAFLPLLAVALVGGVLADRYSRKLLYVGNFVVEAAMLAAFAATALGEGPQDATVETTLFLLGLALFVAQTTFEPGVLAYFFDVFPEEEGGQVWGLKGAVSKTAGLVGPALPGWLY